MNLADFIILAVLAVSVLIGLWRGLICEVLSLATWIAAFWASVRLGPLVADQFLQRILQPAARMLVGAVLCFVVVLVLGALLRFVVRRLIVGIGLGGADRLFGMVFGFARGVLVVTLAVLVLGFTAATRYPWWQQSRLLPPFQGTATWLGQWLPDNARTYFHPAAVLDRLPLPPVTLPASLPGMPPPPAHSPPPAAPAGDRAKTI